MKGILIDCYKNQNKIILWIKQGKNNLRLEDSFTPKIYVKHKDLRFLQKKLFYWNINSKFTKKNTFFKEDMWVLEVPIQEYHRIYPIVKLILRLTNYSAEIYNADLKLEEYYFFEKDLFPLAKVEFKESNGKIIEIKALDDSNEVYYQIPDFSVGKLGTKTEDNLFKGFNTKLNAILFNKNVIEGKEKDILLEFKNQYNKLDPDVLWTDNGNIRIPFLKHKLKQHNILFNFNRFEKDDFDFKQGEHYFSYSRVVFRTNSIFLKGRLNFDKRSFFADDTGFYGIIDGARACRFRIQRTAMRSAGAAVTNLLLYTAYKRNFLLPYKVGIYERFKTLDELYNADRGSMIYEPRVGFHTDVAEFDFTSLYPNIMNKFNLSPETLFCKCCKWNKVSGLHYNYCTKKRGIVPIVAKDLVSRRILMKKQATPESKEKVDYHKWLLVTLFGYQAFRNRKIGCIENHESIQAFAREALLQAVRASELHDWEVIHGIIDSLYVKKKGFTDNDVQRLGREIYSKTGLELSHEGNYRWIVFLPSIVNPYMPVSSHFYCVFEDGGIKTRGIEARRKDMAKIMQDMQLDMIKILSKAKNESQFRSHFPEVIKILKNYINVLPHAPVEDLMFTKTLSKIDYANDIAQKLIVDKMKKEGYDVQPGQTIAYVIRDVTNKNPLRRYVTTDSFDGKVDVKKYTDLLVRSTFSILQPFGLSMEYLYEKIGKLRQLKITQFIKDVEILVSKQ